MSEVKGELEMLRRKLLDLTLRNRMLNYRASVRLGVAVLGESSFEVHKLMVEQGKRMSFVGKAEPPLLTRSLNTVRGHDDPVALETHRRAAEEELDAFLDNAAVPVDQMDTKLNVSDTESVLQIKLRAIQREANLANEELGINTLFLTLGTLEWRETPERSFRAPLLYVPVKLETVSNASMRLLHDGNDVGENLPLRAKLKEFNLKLPEFTDEKSLLTYFEELESTIQSRDDWAVHRDEVCLGFFNYEKYAMYADLSGEQWPEEQKPWMNADLTSMLGGGYSPAESPFGDETQLDQIRSVADSHEVYDADSSQVLAMVRAAEGHSIVVEGPPGTGKSQTITNMIAECVAAGKTVLFVSAKRAALDVVKRKLQEADLGDICLDLHDKLTNRREFYGEIKRTADKSLRIREEAEKVARLTELRDKLNAHAQAVNAPLAPFGITPFEAMGRLGALPKEDPLDREARIPFEALSSLTEAQIRSSLPAIQALQTKLNQTGVPMEHPFWGAEINSIDPAIRLDLGEELGHLATELVAAQDAIAEASAALHIVPPSRLKDVAVLRSCLERALSAPALDGVAVKTDSWLKEEAQILEAISLVRRHQLLTTTLKAQVNENAWAQDFSGLEPIFERWSPRWYSFLSGKFRAAKASLQPFLMGQFSGAEKLGIVRSLNERKQLDSRLVGMSFMGRLYGVQWQGACSDADVLQGLLEWVVDLHRSVSTTLPSGLLDLFAGQVEREDLKIKVETASNCTVTALARAKIVHVLLLLPELDPNASFADLLGKAQRWQASLPRLTEIIALNESRKSLVERGLKPLVDIADRWPRAAQGLSDSFLRSYYTGVVREAMASRPELRSFDRHLHESEIAEFCKLDDFKLLYNRARVRMAHVRNIPAFDLAAPGSNLHLLRVQCELKTRHKPIRWILLRAGEAIQRIKPVFMMSPLSVAIHLPPELPAFDVVIFDEASQVRPEDAMCAVIRAKQAVVVGDTRQMPPTSFFDRVADDAEIDDDSEDFNEAAQEMSKLESVLSLMSTAAMGKTRRPDLRWHYRSVHPSLIQPSNEMFYNNRLIIFPSPGDRIEGKKIGVVFHHDASTVYEPGSRKRINNKEADQIVSSILKHLQVSPGESLMVAAMNKTQADLIYDKLLVLERLHPVLFRDYRAQHPHEPLDVKNLENVQGDERDVVYISITYGRDSAGTVRQQFGPLLRDGGERRLNVLITRARRRCEVFSNMTSDDIRVDGPRPGLLAFKRYLRFAEMGDLGISAPTGDGEESPFEEEVSLALTQRGYEVATQVGCAEFRIDLAVRDPLSPSKFLLGIECDGATYHSARSARDRDKLRQRVLENRGWRIHRIWSHDWWQDREAEISRLVAAIEGESATQMQTAEEPESAFIEEAPREEANTSTRPYPQPPQPEAIGSRADLEQYLLRVVAYEGPIHHELLIVRLRDASGFGRAGKTLRDHYEALILNAEAAKKVFKSGDAYYTDGHQLLKPRDWSLRPASERKISFLTDVELVAALRGVIQGSYGVEAEPAIKSAYGQLGFKRVGEDALNKGHAVIRQMEAQGIIKLQGALIRLVGT